MAYKHDNKKAILLGPKFLKKYSNYCHKNFIVEFENIRNSNSDNVYQNVTNVTRLGWMTENDHISEFLHN